MKEYVEVQMANKEAGAVENNGEDMGPTMGRYSLGNLFVV